jgi:hypothetical protein
MRSELFQPTIEGEARILLLIEAFSQGNNALEGRTKLAKLDFFLRYSSYFYRALQLRGAIIDRSQTTLEPEDIETRMVRFRYGPWDPSYYAILGRLIGKCLIEPIPFEKGIGYKITIKGQEIANQLKEEPTWIETVKKLGLLKKHLNLNGTTLKNFIYDHFPEVTKATWGEPL